MLNERRVSGQRTRLTEAAVRELIARYLAGETVPELAVALGIADNTVRRELFERAGIEPRHRLRRRWRLSEETKRRQSEGMRRSHAERRKATTSEGSQA